MINGRIDVSASFSPEGASLKAEGDLNVSLESNQGHVRLYCKNLKVDVFSAHSSDNYKAFESLVIGLLLSSKLPTTKEEL